jgi:DNA-binding response OmpR family regulator
VTFTVSAPARWHNVLVRILLIEDDLRLAERTAEYLRGHDAEVELVADGEAGLGGGVDKRKKNIFSPQHDIVLLDLMLPGLDGLELCKRLRSASAVPVIMLTARGEEVDRIVGLEIGADDYVAKPFSPRELLARIRAVLRRHAAPVSAARETATLQVDAFHIDRDRRVASFDGAPVELTAYQFDLLWVLAHHPGRVMPRAQLHTAVRELRDEPPTDFDPAVDRSIDVHLSKIRSALAAAAPGGDRLIRTIRGVGYVLGGDE